MPIHHEAELVHTLCQYGEQISMLKRMPRMGWLQRGVSAPESVAEHSYGVAMLALVLADLCEVDRVRVLELALLHDLAEAMLTDLPHTAQQLLGAHAKHSAEQQAINNILAGLPHAERLLDHWQDYALGISREARLVKALDRLEMLIQALAYEQAGQRNLAEFWQYNQAIWAEFPVLGQIATELEQRRP